MSPRTAKNRSKAMSRPRRAHTVMSREARATYAEIERGVKTLEKSIGEIQRSLRKAEQKIEADARGRIRELRKAARTQLGVVKVKQREAADALKRVRTAASGSWDDIKRSVDSVLADIGATASAVVERFRSALGG